VVNLLTPKPADRRVLLRYRVLAYTTAILLIILVFVGIPLQVWYHNLWVVRVVGTLHGYLYIVYLLVAFEFTRRLRVPLPWMLLVLLAGTIPFCAIVAERLLTRRFHRLVGSSGREVSAAMPTP
jgi:integral membrane protein